MSLVIDSVCKKYGRFPALNGASLTAPQGAFVALLGPSGSGKTTLLRILGGLEAPDSGNVRFADLNWLDMPARERKAGFVFQQYALFRHMTVAKNIAFGLEVRPRSERPSRADIKRRVEELLDLVQLQDLGKRRGHAEFGEVHVSCFRLASRHREPRWSFCDCAAYVPQL